MKKRCLIVALICFAIAIGTYCFAAKQINLVATERMTVSLQVVKFNGGYTCNIAVSGAVLDDNGDVVTTDGFEMNINDLGPTLKEKVVDILRAANIKLNLKAIEENVDTLPTID